MPPEIAAQIQLNPENYEFRTTCAARGDVVDELVDTSLGDTGSSACGPKPGRERLVIPYSDEETLWGSSQHLVLWRFGYTSRADALKNIDRCVTTAVSSKRLLKKAVFDTNLTFLAKCRVELRRLASGFGLSGTPKIMRNLPHNGLAALIFFYSRNVLCSTVRAFISFSYYRTSLPTGSGKARRTDGATARFCTS